MNTPRFYLSKEELPEATALSRSTIEEEIRQGRFPKPRQLSKGRVGYLVREVSEWAESRPVADTAPPPNTGHLNRRRSPRVADRQTTPAAQTSA